MFPPLVKNIISAAAFIMILFSPAHSLAPGPVSNALLVDRRSVLTISTATISSSSLFAPCSSKVVLAAATASNKISSRLEQTILTMPPPSSPTDLTNNGVDNVYFPSFLQGDWSVTQTLVDTQTPLGLNFVGGPNGDAAIAAASVEEARSQLGRPVRLQLRFLHTKKWGVAEDRLFNTRQRLDAFAGKPVVASVEYANVGASNRASVLNLGGTEEDPLQTTVVRFRGPAAQKTFVVSHGEERISDTQWAGYELDRSIFALTNQSTAPPLTTDSELIWYFEQLDENHVRGKLRIAGYLNAQSDKLYFEARNRAVSLQDYTLDMRRL